MWIEKLFDLVAKESSRQTDGSVAREAKGRGYGWVGVARSAPRENP